MWVLPDGWDGTIQSWCFGPNLMRVCLHHLLGFTFWFTLLTLMAAEYSLKVWCAWNQPNQHPWDLWAVPLDSRLLLAASRKGCAAAPSKHIRPYYITPRENVSFWAAAWWCCPCSCRTNWGPALSALDPQCLGALVSMRFPATAVPCTVLMSLVSDTSALVSLLLMGCHHN